MVRVLSFISAMKYSQIIAELNLPRINNKLLGVIHVFDVLRDKVLVDFLCQDALLIV
jgi:hypothetical protein